MRTKIFISYPKAAQLLDDPVFIPIHVGRANGYASKDTTSDLQELNWLTENCIGDDTGENISKQNNHYCELTAMYWVWKNIDKFSNTDYIGFFHYNRHLRFNDNSVRTNKYGLIVYKNISQKYIKENSLDRSSIEKIVLQYDVVTTQKWNVQLVGSQNLYEHYGYSSPCLHISDYQKALKILGNLYPEYLPAIKKYNFGKFGYFTNIFIMKKSIFIEYCSWLFPVLVKLHRELDVKLYNTREYRVISYISEWLFGIWLTKNRNNFKIKELMRTFVQDTSIQIPTQIKRQFEENSINICLASDRNYIKYLAVTLYSIKKNALSNRCYDVNILTPSLNARESKVLTSFSDSNFKIRLFRTNEIIPNELLNNPNAQGSGHITNAAFYRLFIPLIFNQYDKILYLDSDLVVNADVAALFDVDITGYLIAGVRDVELIRWYLNDQFIREYIDKKLQHNDVYDYINSGVLLINIKEMNKIRFVDKAKRHLISSAPLFHDQDIINKLCYRRIKHLDLEWNVEYHIPIASPTWESQIPLSLLKKYIDSRNHPKIVHFAGSIKPWNRLDVDLGELFWAYARQTTVYEEILSSAFLSVLHSDAPKTISKNMIQIKYTVYKLANLLSFGKSKKILKGYRKYKALYKAG